MLGPLSTGCSYFGCRVYRRRNAAGGRCLRVTPGPRGCVAGPAERGWGRRGRAETPPLPRAGEVLFLGSRAGATALPAPPVNVAGMTNGAGGFGLAPGGGAERGPRSPSGRAIPSSAATLRSPGATARARGGCSWGHQITRCAWGRVRTGGQGLSPPGMAEDLRRGRGCPVWGTGMCWALQRCWPGHERGVGSSSSSSSSSLKLLKEAISGRAGNSYHSLLTPGRQEGESASPPHPHRARRAGTARPHGTPEQGHGVPRGGGHPSGLTPVPTANPSGWLCPVGKDQKNPYSAPIHHLWKRAGSERHQPRGLPHQHVPFEGSLSQTLSR